jgi:hypothetical protein
MIGTAMRTRRRRERGRVILCSSTEGVRLTDQNKTNRPCMLMERFQPQGTRSYEKTTRQQLHSIMSCSGVFLSPLTQSLPTHITLTTGYNQKAHRYLYPPSPLISTTSTHLPRYHYQTLPLHISPIYLRRCQNLPPRPLIP